MDAATVNEAILEYRDDLRAAGQNPGVGTLNKLVGNASSLWNPEGLVERLSDRRVHQ